MPNNSLIAVRLDAEDRATLDAVVAYEKLTLSDVVRRAIRAYAKQLGVKKKRKARR
jgi:antitoxin component of RelBE/YafQ-DinJ toxin-antitoxin module